MRRSPASNMDVRKANRNRIYRLIHRKREISKPEIAQYLQMSMPTVLLNCKSLLEQGFIHESGSQQSTGGRKAAVLSIVKDARLAVGIDITRQHLVAALVDLEGSVVLKQRLALNFSVNPSYANRVGETVEQLLTEANVGRERLIGAGVSIPGVLSPDGRMLTKSHVLRTHDYSFAEIDARIGLPCAHVNDANAAGITETWSADSNRNFVYLSLNNSVGGVLMWDGVPQIGDHQRSGEIGHMTIERGGLRCYCGKRGCLDAYCNAAILSKHTDGNLARFFRRLDADEPDIRVAWEDYIDYLTSALNSLHMIFDTDVIIGGYIGNHIGDRLSDVQQAAAKLNTFAESGEYIKACRQKTEASAIGAALLQIERYINSI